jgi:hypothetical protein
MKAYVITTGAIFGLVSAAHIWRAAVEGSSVAKNPVFLLLTVIAAGLAIWAWRVARAMPRS